MGKISNHFRDKAESKLDETTLQEKHTVEKIKKECSKKMGIDIVDNVVTAIHERCISSYKQITALVVFDLAYVLAYSGLDGTTHYLFDLSASGSGKDSAADHSKELLLSPIIELQKQEQKEYRQQQKENSSLPSKMFKSIHGGHTTVQAIYKGFEVVPVQAIRRGETGVLMRDKNNPMLNFIIDSYGKKRIEMPSYKKEIDDSIPLDVNNASLFFYGNSNLSMLGKEAFRYHIKGGMLNRCFLLFEDYRRPFEKRPESYDMPVDVLDEVHDWINDLILFANKFRDEEKPVIPRTKDYMQFARWIYDKEDELRNTDSQEIHKRTMQNLHGIIYTFHYLSCYENHGWRAEIAEETVVKAIHHVEWIISEYDILMEEIAGVLEEIRTDEKSNNILQYIAEQKLPISLRQIYRKFHLRKADVESAIARVYRHDGKDVLSKIVNVTKGQ